MRNWPPFLTSVRGVCSVRGMNTETTTAAAAAAIPRLSADGFDRWLAGIDTFLFDCDGVLWRGDTPIEGAASMLELLRSLGKRVVFVTNNSSKTRQTHIQKLAGYGIPAEVDDIVTSGWATAQYLRNKGVPTGSRVYVVGELGLAEELTAQGFNPLGLDHSDLRGLPSGPFTVDASVKAVVVGSDRFITFYKAAYASTCVRQIPGCHFVGTNPDPTFPIDGAVLPGGGSFVEFVATGAGRYSPHGSTAVWGPDAVVGKPSQDLLKTILATYNLNPQRTCMVGDRLSTDIEFGKRGGLHTLLVLSGVTHESELTQISDPFQVPEFVVDSVDTLNQLNAETSHQ